MIPSSHRACWGFRCVLTSLSSVLTSCVLKPSLDGKDEQNGSAAAECPPCHLGQARLATSTGLSTPPPLFHEQNPFCSGDVHQLQLLLGFSLPTPVSQAGWEALLCLARATPSAPVLLNPCPLPRPGVPPGKPQCFCSCFGGRNYFYLLRIFKSLPSFWSDLPSRNLFLTINSTPFHSKDLCLYTYRGRFKHEWSDSHACGILPSSSAPPGFHTYVPGHHTTLKSLQTQGLEDTFACQLLLSG